MRLLAEQSADLSLWQEKPLSVLWNEKAGSNFIGKQRTKAIIDDVTRTIDVLRKSETDYAGFDPPRTAPFKAKQIVSHGNERLLGRCPCPVSGEKTRCCNLLTLDAVRQCGFACSYCSIQSFYHRNEVLFAKDLGQRLHELEILQDAWHIGTGQSSDSLMWGDDQGVLSALASFARSRPRIILELKTKSARTDWIGRIAMPPNVVATWSVNAPTIVSKEEHLTASLDERIGAARKAADGGLPVGFHFHPLVRFSGWQEEYASVVDRITGAFSPEEIVMISLGTLTFTKQALRQLRESGKPTRIHQMELTGTAGKYSYPAEVKRRLFTHVHSCFPVSWRTESGPFFYLCMESPELWEPVLGRSYPDNASFEADMRRHYMKSITQRHA